MENFLGSQFIKKNKLVQIEEIKNADIVLLYVGAKWSGPCKKILPYLKKLYDKSNRKQQVLEIIYLSCDKNEEDFNEAIDQMPWCYISYKEQGLREIIVRHYNLVGIPSLLLISPWGNCVSSDCVTNLAAMTVSQCVELWRNRLSESSRPSLFG
ncbi:hypothetical protein SteCoe_14453 [Stentor coeruleus]|uniref:Thioredoxin-like fold domain-containing protein n=1 Tax=Stentor coeruleus TaxID=5963 RepID=A0A1R2C630_9CILI|nr:hypothetical protein SteCoe_14453 [Stentor coeruleus]